MALLSFVVAAAAVVVVAIMLPVTSVDGARSSNFYYGLGIGDHLRQGLDEIDSNPEEAENLLQSALQTNQIYLRHYSELVDKCWEYDPDLGSTFTIQESATARDRAMLAHIACEMATHDIRTWLRAYHLIEPLLQRAAKTVRFPQRDVQALFTRAINAYRKGNLENAIGLFEASMGLARDNEILCYAKFCYKHMLSEPRGPDHAITQNDIAAMLECRRQCALQQQNVSLDNSEHIFLVAVSDHLQMAYYQMKDLAAAARCAEVGLIINPENQMAKNNMQFFDQKGEPEYQTLCTLVRERLRAMNNIQDALQTLPYEPQYNYAREVTAQIGRAECEDKTSLCSSWLQQGFCQHTWASERCPKSCGFCTPSGPFGTNLPAGVHVIEDFCTPEECNKLFEFSYQTIPGDGYRGNDRPFSNAEVFSGLTPTTVAQIVKQDTRNTEAARLYRDISARMLERASALIGTPVYYHYIHLVSRTAPFDVSSDRLSHPIHGDNCYNVDGVCAKQPPAFVDRDYSAILFLNDNIEGGQFFFSDDFLGTNSVFVQPKRGRLIVFPAGLLHGVTPLKSKERRSVVAHWYTLKQEASDSKYFNFGI